MKKPHVLNRPMFNTGGTSAYGRGISANLITEEQRQRFNNGGRVKYYEDYRGGPVYMGGTDIPQWWDPSWGPALQSGEQSLVWDPDARGGEGAYVPGGGAYKVIGAELGEEKMDYIPTSRMEQAQKYPSGKIPRLEDLDIDYMKSQAGSKRDALERSLGYDIGTPVEGGGTKYEVSPTEPDRVFGEPRKSIFGPIKETEEAELISKGPMGDKMWNQIRDDTDELDTPDRWAFLDENITKKKKLARGHALMEGAAAAADFAVAATPEKRGAAISKGLRGVGTIGAKYKGEAEDIKTKAKILGTIEDIKGERKEKQFEKQQEGYYDKMIDIRQEELELKKEAAKIAATDAPPEEQYQAMLVKGLLDVPQKKARLLGSILKKKIYYAGDKKTEDQYLNPENNGLLFVDVNGTIFRNVNGEKKDVKIYEDTEFFGK